MERGHLPRIDYEQKGKSTSPQKGVAVRHQGGVAERVSTASRGAAKLYIYIISVGLYDV